MKATAADIINLNKEQWKQTLADYAAAKASANAGYQTAMNQAPAAYQPIETDAQTQAAMLQQNNNAYLADIGQGAQQPLTLQNNAAMALQNRLGQITRHRQQYTGGLEARRQEAAAGLTANWANAAAANTESLNDMLIGAQNQARDIYYNMLLKKKITARQFEKSTGIPINKYRRAKKNSGDGGFDPADRSTW